jgi:RNA polymerase sigma-70 factor (ECF subfamily)
MMNGMGNRPVLHGIRAKWLDLALKLKHFCKPDGLIQQEQSFKGMNEEQWVRKAQKGDHEAFEQLVMAHQQFVYNLALRSLGAADDAQDIAQEAFLRAWLALPRFRRQSSFRTWLYRIVINLCYNRLPKLRQELAAIPVDQLRGLNEEHTPGSPVEAAWPLGGPLDPAAALEANERREFLQQQIDNLPEAYRALILLRYAQGLAYEEIANVMDIPLGTVKTGLHRAHRQLRQALLEHEEEMT